MTTTSIQEALLEPFPTLVITCVNYVAFGENRQVIVPHRIYGYGKDRVPTVLDALEVLFRQLNHVDGSELISEPEFKEDHPRLRSMSVGDRVTFRGPGGWLREFVCEGCGWGWKEVR
jgi:hypothetical protein